MYRFFKTVGIMLLLNLMAGGIYAQESVDLVIVHKGKRKMVLVANEKPIRTYKISLGGNPRGHKIRQGDHRTPEGRYVIDYRNPGSRYHLSLHISYPSEQDRRRARQRGDDPGGMIMIHGLPNRWGRDAAELEGRDWTDGCIAVSNQAIEEIWQLVHNGTPVEIKP